MNLLLCYENPVLVTGSSGAGKSLIINKLLEKMIKPGSTQLTEETILGQVIKYLVLEYSRTSL